MGQGEGGCGVSIFRKKRHGSVTGGGHHKILSKRSLQREALHSPQVSGVADLDFVRCNPT